jgi:hypothetical protein
MITVNDLVLFIEKNKKFEREPIYQRTIRRILSIVYRRQGSLTNAPLKTGITQEAESLMKNLKAWLKKHYHIT